VTGASYTDVNAELPALYLLLGVSAVAIVLVLVASAGAGSCCPVRRSGCWCSPRSCCRAPTRRDPAAAGRPAGAGPGARVHRRNLEATRAAYGLDDVELEPFDRPTTSTRPTSTTTRSRCATCGCGTRNVLETTYQELQALRPYYQFNDVDVDRYEIDGSCAR
jgi:uncharacterized protein